MKAFFFDDFTIGDTFRSPARTITEADLVLFAGLTGVAGLSYAVGLEQRCGLKEGGGALLVLGLTWDYKLPIYVGDTIHVFEVVTGKRVSSKDPSRGIVQFSVLLKNQDDNTTQEGEWKVMYKVRNQS
jgi:acyl dehydratase